MPNATAPMRPATAPPRRPPIRRTRRPRARSPPRPGWRRRGGHGRPADEGRQQALRPRLLEMHPLLQVRRCLWRGGPEHVRDRRRGTRLRCPDLDRAGGAAARVGLRLLRQLHRRLPDRRADVQVRVRHARGRDLGRVGPDRDRHDLPVLRRRLRGQPPRPGRPDRQGDLADSTRRSPTATCASRAASASNSSTTGRARARRRSASPDLSRGR